MPNFVRTSRGIIPMRTLRPVSRDGNSSDILATDRGTYATRRGRRPSVTQ